MRQHRIPSILCSFFFLFLLTILSACSQGTPSPAAQTPTIPLADCILTLPGNDVQIDAQCGTLTVYENPATQTGRQIDLHLAVIPAVNRNHAPDPFFFLTGGPGQAATESFITLRPAFREINRDRDIVLVDQRGTGQSHPLRCEFPEEPEPGPDDLRPLLEACLSQLDADPRFYTTSIAMQDLDQVREALGYTQINLYGVSYGTRAALTYLRMSPDRVRAVILDGLAPPQLPLGLDVAADAQHALELVFARCQANPGCAERFPNFATQFEQILATLEEAPVPVSFIHPTTGATTELDFTQEMFTVIVRFYLYSPETVALLPLLVSSAVEQGEYARLASQYITLTSDLTQSINNAMGYSVQCAEDVPFFSPEEANQVNQDTFMGDMVSGGLAEICEIWPRGEIPPDFKEPVRSDVPVLLLSGEYDPVTPPEYAELAAQTLTNHLHLIAPGQGHNVVGRGCLPRIITRFINTAAFDALEPDCVNQIVPFPFFVTFSGPMP